MAEALSDGQLQKIENLFKNWNSSENPLDLNLLITGKTGVGKSRLVNALVGRKVAKEGHIMKDPCQCRVEFFEVTIENVAIKVWDSPGLQDGTCNEDQYIQDMRHNIKDIALMIYCVRMDETRFYDADKKAIRILTEEFGKDSWKHAVVALTFANKVEDPDGEDELEYFQSELEEWKKQFTEYFASVGVDPKVSIPVIPVGNKVKSSRLPDRENWLSDLWIDCYHVMKSSARIGMYRINKKRLMVGGSTVNEKTDDDHDDEFTSIALNNEQQEVFLSSTWKAILPFFRDVAVDVVVPLLRKLIF